MEIRYGKIRATEVALLFTYSIQDTRSELFVAPAVLYRIHWQTEGLLAVRNGEQEGKDNLKKVGTNLKSRRA